MSKPGKLEINDEVAKNLGLESAEKLREIVKSQLESQHGTLTRQKVKRELLDALDEQYSFEAPSKLVEAEFGNIWNQVNQDLAQASTRLLPTKTPPRKKPALNISVWQNAACAWVWCWLKSASRQRSRSPTKKCSARCSNSSAAIRPGAGSL